MSQIICNSGPLLALGILARRDLLKALFDVVLVPEAVQKEIEPGGIKLAGLEDFRRANWIRVVPLQGKRDARLESLLDVGEAAVISLTCEQPSVVVLIDECKARKVARDVYGLQPIGTARILVEAKRKKAAVRHRPAVSKTPAGGLLDPCGDCRNGLARSRGSLNFVASRNGPGSRSPHLNNFSGCEK